MSLDYFIYKGDETVGAYVCRQLEGAGLTRVDDVAQAEIAFTYYLHPSMIEDAYFDDEGLVKNASAGTVLVDLSPSTPTFSRELSAIATVNDLHFVEAPLALIDPRSDAAFGPVENVACFAAGEEDDVEVARDALEVLASRVDFCGPAGSAQLAKAAHTVQFASRAVGAVEAAALNHALRSAASSVDGALDVTASAEGSSQDLMRAIAEERFDDGMTVELLMADVAAAMTAADDVDLILPQLEAAMHLLELMAVIGGADKGIASLALLYREEAASAAHGLDWTRAEGLYDAELGDLHDHAHAHDDFDEDDFGFMGGFGGYSAN